MFSIKYLFFPSFIGLVVTFFSVSTIYGLSDFKITGDSGVVSAGSSSSFAIQSDGSLWAWGNNHMGRLGDGTAINQYTPIKVMNDVVSVSMGGHTMAIKSDGSLWGWGGNSNGQIGDGTTVSQQTPVRIMDDVVAVSAGFGMTMAIRSDSSLWAWGRIGLENNFSSSEPIRIMDEVIAVSTSYHTLVIKPDSSLWAWGGNSFGQLGDGTTIFRDTPVKIMDDVIAVSAGDIHSKAIRADGSLWAWGRNFEGMLGDGTTTDRHTPVKILDEVAYVSTGIKHTAAIRTDGSLWIWGVDYGAEYYGTEFESYYGYPFFHVPTWIMDDVVAVSTGGFLGPGGASHHTVAVRTDGSLWTWGMNSGGQLGDGTTTDRNEPKKIMENVMLPGGATQIPLPNASPSPNTPTLRFTINSNHFSHNGTTQQADAAPFISHGRAMVPLRIVAEALGVEVDWDNDTRTVIIAGRGETMYLVVDVPLPDDMGTPIIVNGLTFVPVRYVSEKLGATVRWDGENASVYVYQ